MHGKRELITRGGNPIASGDCRIAVPRAVHTYLKHVESRLAVPLPVSGSMSQSDFAAPQNKYNTP